jgi:drug/metabolite transporter (DMT)-like permease
VFTATAGKLIYGERGGWPLVGSIGLGIVGVVVIGLGDFSLSPEHLPGDAMAVLCSALFTVYFLAGKQVRRSLDNRVYAPTIYGLAGLMCWALVPVLGLPAVDYDGRTWLAFGLMALVPTMIGHTSMNLALRYIDAGRISVLTLSEPIFAGLVAAWVWGEPMTVPTIVGYLLISSSVLVVMWDRGGSPWRGDSTAAPGDPSVAAGDAETG